MQQPNAAPHLSGQAQELRLQEGRVPAIRRSCESFVSERNKRPFKPW